MNLSLNVRFSLSVMMVAIGHNIALDAMVSIGHIVSYGHMEAPMKDRKSVQLRLPTDLKAWIAAEADRNASSQNSEIVRAVRERMERDDIERLRAEARALQAHADLLEAEGMGGFTAPTA